MDPSQIPLRDLHLPEAIGWWPPAPGWWLLAAAVLIAAAVLARRAYRRYRRAAARRRALSILKEVEIGYRRHGNAVTAARELSTLLRRAMIAYAPRGEVAGLHGDRWLEWLDRGMPEPEFRSGTGRLLLDLPYRSPEAPTPVDAEALFALVRRRLSTPVGEAA